VPLRPQLGDLLGVALRGDENLVYLAVVGLNIVLLTRDSVSFATANVLLSDACAATMCARVMLCASSCSFVVILLP
jgi:hypothetical protein